MTTYSPQPLDTSSVVLPVALQDLLEKLAENTHEVWAAQRIKDGWVYGPQRDDKQKHHPCLLPYNELLESEKEYDRKTAGETLKAVMALGYQIVAPD